jgi:hypothetical protein
MDDAWDEPRLQVANFTGYEGSVGLGRFTSATPAGWLRDAVGSPTIGHGVASLVRVASS